MLLYRIGQKHQQNVNRQMSHTNLKSSVLSLRLQCSNTHTFNSPLSRTIQVSRYQKGKISLDFTEARDSEWQWHQLGHMQVCISLQTDNHASTPPLSFLTGRMPFLPLNQQCQNTEGKCSKQTIKMCTMTRVTMWPFTTKGRIVRIGRFLDIV